ncbi:MAG: PD-(D/E)XK nuclease family protein [Planctomycetaceae bacterium]|jgi:RecB family exonuclease|nr:PD-(D/E)XK nuclease family protein [Planctomycetaceae bacterium]
MKRVFLNWNVPVLEQTAEYLVRRYHRHDGHVDMRRVLIAVTGSQAKRRLEELLQQNAAEIDPAWYPPKLITTMGTFPELLYPQKKPAASDLVQQLAWSKAFETLNRERPESVRSLVGQLPAQDDWTGRLALGKLMAKLHLELAADRVDFGMVAEYCRQKYLNEEAGLIEEFQRWNVLAELQKLYIAELDAVELWDIQSARAYAVEHDECKTDSDVILVGLSDLNRMQRIMLDTVESHVTSLIFAPESLADLFDKHGCVNAERWQQYHHLDLPDDVIEMTESPSEQATAVLHWLQKLEGQYAAEEIVIGVPDDSIVPFLSQQLGQVGLGYRHVAGTPISQTPVFLLLESLADYLQNKRFHDLTTLLRHPDMERFINEQLPSDKEQSPPDKEQSPPNKEQSWLTEFDLYYQNHLPLTVDGKWLLKPRRETEDDSTLDVSNDSVPAANTAETENVSERENEQHTRAYSSLPLVYDITERWIAILFDLFDADKSENAESNENKNETESSEELSNKERKPSAYNINAKRSPRDWAASVKRLLFTLYGNPKPYPASQDEHVVAKTFEQFEDLYRKLDNIPKPLTPDFTASEILTLMLRMLSAGRIPPMQNPHEIEMLGWLELLTDDAPAIAITGLNEGIVPSSKSADMFLPDGMRRELQLEDNARRYARDAYALSAIMASRKNVRLIFSKRSIDGNPLVPSRLFFATDEKHVAERVLRFFSEPKAKTVRPVFAGSLQAGQKKSLFQTPEPVSTDYHFDSIRVTEFRDYLQCPYRYYLKHRLRLDITDDSGEELSGGAFGDVTHRVLKLFGRSRIKNSQNAEEIRDFLRKQLDVVVRDLYGAAFRPVIAVQTEQIRLRLDAFADKQAKHAAEGYEIQNVEYSPPTSDGSVIIDVDGQPIKIRGRIDRVDYNIHTDKYMLLDYKTTSSGDKPENVHRPKGEWVDLQLPLYELIFSKSRFEDEGNLEDAENIELGYVSLPKDTSKTEFLKAKWQIQDLHNARETAFEVIRKIRREEFFPPTSPPPKFSEIYSPICLDHRLELFEEEE